MLKRGDLMGQKKGQITVYIIIGIIALIGVGIFFYMRGITVEAPAEYKPTIEEIPVEAAPIREFVEVCLRSVAEDGLKLIGDYGGYTSFEKMRASLNPYMPTEAEAVQFSPGSDLRIPYWWHMSADNNCEKSGTCRFASKRPNLYRLEGGTNIEEQLDEYVNENLKVCLRDFVDLEEYGFEISELGDVDTKTVVTQESVAFHTKYPLVAEKAGVSYQINEFFVDIPLRLKEMYEFATNITNAEVTYSFLEKFIKNTIALYSDVDRNALPPFGASGIDSNGGVTWMKANVEKKLKQILASNMAWLQIYRTDNFRFVLFPESDVNALGKMAITNNNNLVPLIEDHPNHEVKFTYLDWWNPYFNLNCNGQLCGPEKASGIGTVTFFLQRYHFNYDVSLPVLVDIVDLEAFKGAGWSFKFFLEANLRDNTILAEGLETIGEAIDTGGGTMLCDENKRNSPEVTIKTFNGFTGYELGNVKVMYSCGNEDCYIGETDEEGELVTKLPVCAGGAVGLTKSGFLGTSAALSTTMREPAEMRLTMNPVLKRDVEVKKYKAVKGCYLLYENETEAEGGMGYTGNDSEQTLFDGGFEETEMIPLGSPTTISTTVGAGAATYSCGWFLYDSKMPLNQYEEATIILNRKSDPGEDPFVAIADYTGDRELEDFSESMDIMAGYYDITINLQTKREMAIPEDERCEGGVIGIGESCGTFERVEFNRENPFASGGIELKDVRISTTNLAQNDKITFYVISIALEDAPEYMRVHEDMEEVTKIKDYSEMYKSMFLPEYEETEEGTRTTFVIE